MTMKSTLSISPNKPEGIGLKKLKSAVLQDSVVSIISKYKKTKNIGLYESLINCLKLTPFPRKLCSNILIQLREIIPILDKDAEQVVLGTLQIPWQYEDKEIELLFTNFVVSLVTAHNYFVSPIFECLLSQLIPVISEKDSECLRENPFRLSETQLLGNYKVLNLIKTIFSHVPLCENILLKSLRNSCPYFKQHAHIHTVFVYNMLQLMKLLPSLRVSILEIIMSSVLKLDLHSPRSELDCDSDNESDAGSEDLFPMELDQPKSSTEPITSHAIGHSLDCVMTLLFRYIHFISHGGKDYTLLMSAAAESPFTVNGCRAGSTFLVDDSLSKVTNGCECQGKKQDDPALKELYLEFKKTVVKIILPTHSSAHAQFVIFHILSLRPSFVSDFVDYLRVMFETPVNSIEEKRSAAAFMGSLLARGKFIKFSHVHYCLEILRNWCKAYLHSEFYLNHKYEDLELHHHFYCACLTLFYVFTFNYKEYTQSKSRLRLAQSLHLEELVLSPLNPLRFCGQAITVNFAAITCHFQLAYCYSVLQSNCRLFLPMSMQNSYGILHSQTTELEMYFPFDPYLLRRSDRFICQHYKEFDGLPDEIMQHSTNMNEKTGGNIKEKETWDMEENMLWNSPQSLKFSYEISPGFKNF